MAKIVKRGRTLAIEDAAAAATQALLPGAQENGKFVFTAASTGMIGGFAVAKTPTEGLLLGVIFAGALGTMAIWLGADD